MHPLDTLQRNLTRRQLFQRVGMGVGGFALADLLARDLGASDSANQFRHFAPKAKSVIYFHLVGAPSHLDLFDYKPELQKRTGELCPAEMFEGKQGQDDGNNPYEKLLDDCSSKINLEILTVNNSTSWLSCIDYETFSGSQPKYKENTEIINKDNLLVLNKAYEMGQHLDPILPKHFLIEA